MQSVYALLLNALVLGIVFARISRPGQRGRTIFLSDSAIVARRDGDLKFMFRVADIRPRYQARWCSRRLSHQSLCAALCGLLRVLHLRCGESLPPLLPSQEHTRMWLPRTCRWRRTRCLLLWTPAAEPRRGRLTRRAPVAA